MATRWFKVAFDGSGTRMVTVPPSPFEEEMIDAAPTEGETVFLYEPMEGGYLCVEGIVGKPDTTMAAWPVSFDAGAVEWKKGEVPLAPKAPKPPVTFTDVTPQHGLAAFVDVFKKLAEGQMEPDAWLAWWSANEAAVGAACSRGQFLRLKPSQITVDHPVDKLGAVRKSLGGVYQVLEALKIQYEWSARYDDEYNVAWADYLAQDKARKKELAKRYGSTIAAIAAHFPKFARFLKRRVENIEELESGLAAEDLAKLEASVGVPLPAAYKRWLNCASNLWIGTLDLRHVLHLSVHRSASAVKLPTEGMLCFAEYWLEADGDQVLFDTVNHPGDDPPVFYYSHEGSPHVRRVASRFTRWIESLPRSPVFAELGQ